METLSRDLIVGETSSFTIELTGDFPKIEGNAYCSYNVKSTDTNVLKITEKGNNEYDIEAVGPGSANIKVWPRIQNSEYPEYGSYDLNQYLFPFSVKDPVNDIVINRIEIIPDIMTLVEGEDKELKVAIYPFDATNQDLTWTSSDNSVATVKDGKVTAISQGNATITCMANDGSGVSASCQVTVDSKPVRVESIELNYSSVNLTEGEGVQLTAKINPAEATDTSVTWSSSDNSVAIADNEGFVATLKAGTAIITCMARDGSGVSASCQVTVKSKIVLVESIELNYSSVELTEREGVQLSAKINPATATDTSVTWSSSDKTVAVVDDEGYVATLKPGTATITCTANDGSGVSASCQVSVKSIIVLVESIELNHYDVELGAGEGIQLTAIVNPESATDSSVTWSSSDKSVAVVDREGYVAAMKEGTATITCMANDGSGVTAYCTITVIDDNAVDSIYGASGITVETGNGMLRITAGRKATVTIYTMNGIMLRNVILEADETEEIALTSGVYIVNGVKYMVD